MKRSVVVFLMAVFCLVVSMPVIAHSHEGGACLEEGESGTVNRAQLNELRSQIFELVTRTNLSQEEKHELVVLQTRFAKLHEELETKGGKGQCGTVKQRERRIERKRKCDHGEGQRCGIVRRRGRRCERKQKCDHGEGQRCGTVRQRGRRCERKQKCDHGEW